MSSQIRHEIGIALVCGLCFAAAAGAKSPETAGTRTGILEGKLTDLYSAPLAGASVVLRNLNTGETCQGVTEENGKYRFTHLGSGEYRLEAQVPRLGNGAVEGILVAAGHATRVQAALAMELPPVSEAVAIHVRELDPVTPAVTTIIPSQELNALPLGSRNWQEFAAITPAGNPAPAPESRDGGQLASVGRETEGDESSGESLSLGGASASRISGRVDGVSIGPASRMGISTLSGQPTQALGESAVQSMEARTGLAADDDGQGIGGAIELRTEHGSNGLHGQAFYLNRQSLWAAQNPFLQRIEETAMASGADIATFGTTPYTPYETGQTLGLGIGSQIRRDKLFWFAALDGLLRNDPALATVRHMDFFSMPTFDELTVFAARLGSASPASLPCSAIPAGPAVLEAAAANYSCWLGLLNGVLGPVPRSSNDWQGFARIDWEASERQHLSVEGNAAYADAPNGALDRSSETYGNLSFGNSHATELWGLAKLESFLTPNLLNSVAAQYRRSVQRETPQTLPQSSLESMLLANSANAFGQLPQIVADSKYGFIFGKPALLGNGDNPDERIFVGQDTVSWVRGAHLVKAGMSFDHISDAVGTIANETGTYSYPDRVSLISDTASFLQYGLDGVDQAGVNQPGASEHNCDAANRVYSITGAALPGGLGPLPCYAWYSQRIGPTHWHLSTNDLAAFVTEQWQPLHNLTLSAGVRAEAEQLPSPIASVENASLPETQKLPAMRVNFAPRFGLAWSPWHTTVLRVGAGLYYGRIDNSVVLAALTQTGSTNGDLNFFFKPTDPGAPPFPYVFPVEPQTAVVPGAVSFAANFRNRQVDQAVFSLEQQLPSHWSVSVSALASLGRKLPISIDTNLAPALDANGNPRTITYAVVDAIAAGPIKAPQITVPLYTARGNTSYQQLASIESRANSTYDAEMVKLTRYGGRGLSLHAHYLYAHATDWNPNESGNVAVNDVFDPADFRLEYGASNLDIRHSAGLTLLYQAPWKARDWAGVFANGWAVAGLGHYRSGLPFTMRTGGSIPGFYSSAGGLIEGVAPGMNGSGGDNRVYGSTATGAVVNLGRNTYRYPATWTADTRLSKRFTLPHDREIEFLAESFNLFNHQNVTLIETTGYTVERGTSTGKLPTLNFMTGLTSAGLPSTVPEFGKPLDVNATNYYHPREFQFGLRTRF